MRSNYCDWWLWWRALRNWYYAVSYARMRMVYVQIKQVMTCRHCDLWPELRPGGVVTLAQSCPSVYHAEKEKVRYLKPRVTWDSYGFGI